MIVFTATLLLLGWLAFFVGSSLAIDNGCNYYQELTPGTTFYVYNPEYPYSYRGQRSCRWNMKSDYRVSLNCTTFQLPWVRSKSPGDWKSNRIRRRIINDLCRASTAARTGSPSKSARPPRTSIAATGHFPLSRKDPR